jgi:hypothetical protein
VLAYQLKSESSNFLAPRISRVLVSILLSTDRPKFLPNHVALARMLSQISEEVKKKGRKELSIPSLFNEFELKSTALFARLRI